jgi:hypothetical protein
MMLFAQQMIVFAQDDGGAVAGAGGFAALLAGMACYFVVLFGMVALLIAGWWKVFTKAGKPGWAAIIPIYNLIVLMEIIGRPLWWVVLLLIPCVNIVVFLIVNMDLAKSFGQGAGFGIGLWLLPYIFAPILGFGKAKYLGPSAPQS